MYGVSNDGCPRVFAIGWVDAGSGRGYSGRRYTSIDVEIPRGGRRRVEMFSMVSMRSSVFKGELAVREREFKQDVVSLVVVARIDLHLGQHRK